MKGDNLSYWNWLLSQRQKDLELELERELLDDNLVKLLKSSIVEAENKIEELKNVKSDELSRSKIKSIVGAGMNEYGGQYAVLPLFKGGYDPVP